MHISLMVNVGVIGSIFSVWWHTWTLRPCHQRHWPLFPQPGDALPLCHLRIPSSLLLKGQLRNVFVRETSGFSFPQPIQAWPSLGSHDISTHLYPYSSTFYYKCLCRGLCHPQGRPLDRHCVILSTGLQGTDLVTSCDLGKVNFSVPDSLSEKWGNP